MFCQKFWLTLMKKWEGGGDFDLEAVCETDIIIKNPWIEIVLPSYLL